MVVKKDNAVVKDPSHNNMFEQYKSTFSAHPAYIKAPIRLKKTAPTRSNSIRSARSIRTEERVDMEAYDPFNDEREDVEDSRSLFSEKSSREMWPQMSLSFSQKDEDYLQETGPTGTPKRKKTGSTPFKSPKPSEADGDGFSDGFRVSYSSSTPQRTSKSSVSSNFTNKEGNQSHPFDEFRGSSATTTPTRIPKPSVLDKYKPSGLETSDGFRPSQPSSTTLRRLSHSSGSSSKFPSAREIEPANSFGYRASQPSSTAPRRLSHSSVSSSKFASTNETEPTNGFRSSFSSAFTPQRGARLSVESTHTNQPANDNGSVTSASQRSAKSTISSLSNKYTANLSQGSSKSNAPRMVVTPLRTKKSSVSNRYLSAVLSKGQDDSNSVKTEITAKVEEPAENEVPIKTESRKLGVPRRSASFSSVSKMWLPKEQPKKSFEPNKKTTTPKGGDDEEKIIESRAAKVEETAKIEVPTKTESRKVGAPQRSASFSSAPKMWLPQEQPKKSFVPNNNNAIPKGEDDLEKMIEARVAMEMSKMKIRFDGEVQRIEELMEQKYRYRIEALEEKTDKMKRVIGKMISKRKSMEDAEMDRLEV
ncbi:MAG: hypothetical protein SGBAC_008681 [Bacillariaceae sp.]